MKRAQSHLIRMFLAHVKSGLISGKENSSGPIALQEMVDALQSVLDGDNIDEALQIKRTAGNPAEDKNYVVAMIMYHYRNNENEKDMVAQEYANEWLESAGYKRLAPSTLRDIRERYHDRIEQLASIGLMIKKTTQDIAKKPKNKT